MSVEMRSVVLFTMHFPFIRGGEEGFVMPEMEWLCKSFDRVIIVPAGKICATSLDLNRFSNVVIDTTWSSYPRSGSSLLSLKTLLCSWLMRGLVTGDWKSLGSGRSAIGDYFRIVRHLVAFRSWLRVFVREQRFDFSKTLFYTFGFTEEATALGLLAASNRALKVVTRMHRFDIFEFAKYPLVLLRILRASAMRGMLRICPCSDDGTHYVRNLYPQFSKKIVTAYLGVRDPIRTRDSSLKDDSDVDNSNQPFRFVSISNVIALKRVGLIGQCLSALAQTFPDRKFVWTHIGGGEMLPCVKDSISSIVPVNLTVEFTGAMDNEDAHKLLSTGFDMGVHLSESEGLPFAIMEILSYGIPVVACDAGGVRECVNDEDGVLLPIEITPSAFVRQVSPMIVDARVRQAKSRAAHKLIREKFLASECRRTWVNELVKELA